MLEAARACSSPCSRSKAGWALGTVSLAFAKSVENMELGHNVGHGQWDWMNDPEIHSNTWEWDMAGLSSQWRYSHNYRHHVFSNVLGMDDDLGFGVMRVTRDEPWQRGSICFSRCETCCWRVSSSGASRLHGFHSERDRVAPDVERSAQYETAFVGKIARQVRQGLRVLSRAEPVSVAPHAGGQRGGQRAAQSVGVRGDLLWALPRRRGEVHRRRPRR